MSRYSDRRHAVEILKLIENNQDDYLIIHYSSESFYDTKGHSPKITSIAIKNFDNEQITSFAIHEFAEIRKIPFNEIQNNYEVLEYELLDAYFKFVNQNKHMMWIHWNMRNQTFGFKALEHRFKVLGGNPSYIEDSKKIDLSKLFKQAYGSDYIDDPRIEKLMEKNHNEPQNFLSGKTEAEYFKENNFLLLSMSTTAKVSLFSDFLTLAIEDKLKTNNSRWKRYGGNILGFYAMIQDNPLANILAWALNLLLGGIIGAIISNLM